VDNHGVQGVLSEPEEDDPLKAAAHLVGMMVNQTKEYTLVFPDDYEPEHLAGRTAIYHTTMLEIKKRELPEMTDEWAKQVSPYDNLAELRKEVESELLTREQNSARGKLVSDYLAAVQEISTAELPPLMIDRRVDRAVNDLSFDVIRQGRTLEEYIKEAGLENEEDLRAQLRSKSEQALKEEALLFAIAREENIEATNEEVEAEIEESVAKFGDRMDEARKILSTKQEEIYARLLTEKAAQHVAALARGEIPEETAEDEPAPNETEATPIETEGGETISHDEEEDQ